MNLQNLHLTDKDTKILFSILKKYSLQFEFYAFGSRVRGTHKVYSDLDLAVIDKERKGLTQIKNDLEESNLSISIDIVDLNTISDEFKLLIKSEMVKITLS